LIWKAI